MEHSEITKAKTHARIASAPFILASVLMLLGSSWDISLLATIFPIAGFGWVGYGLLRFSNIARIIAMMLCFMVFITLPFSFAKWAHLYSYSLLDLTISSSFILLAIYVFWILSRPRTIKLFTENRLA